MTYYIVRGYYTTDRDRLEASPRGEHKKPGALALEVRCDGEAARDLELSVFKKRPDIGHVTVSEMKRR